MTQLTNDNFEVEVGSYKGAVLIIFTAAWDTIGANTIAYLSSLPDPDKHWKICTVNYDVERALAVRYTIRKVPFVIAIKDGVAITSASTCENLDQFIQLTLPVIFS